MLPRPYYSRLAEKLVSLNISCCFETISIGFRIWAVGELLALIRAVFFDLGDTLIVEESMPGKHLWEATSLQKLPHLDEVLAELKQRGYKLGLITNTVTSREEHVRIALRRIDCEKYFDIIVTSVDIGCNKPDKKIFLTALKMLGVKPEEAVMVGNRITADIVGGNRIGMKTILYKWNERYLNEIACKEEQPTRIINSLKELPKILTDLEQ
jgi:putative hydrolase of the HAD superfamily